MIYLDHNATTPIAREAAEAMTPFLYEHFGNPSSPYGAGVAARQAVERARAQVAELLGCDPAEVLFTSGGTESDNHAILGAVRASGRGHVVTSAVEHPAVLEACRWLEGEGLRLTVLPVDGDGLVDPADLARAITPETALVSVMHANNEVGTIQPIAALAAIAHRHGALFHTDAAQSVGKIPVRVDALGVDLLTVAGHKVYAPKGIGVLYVRRGTALAPLLHGGGQEGGRRPGTENVLLAAGLGAACRRAARGLDADEEHLRAMRDRLHAGLRAELGDDGMRLNGHPERRLPNTLSVSFRGVEASTLLAEIGDEVAASAGAACHADRVEISSVLAAMQVPEAWAMGTVRFSTGRGTTPGEIDRAVAVVAGAVRRLQPAAPGASQIEERDGPIRLTRYTRGLGCACKLRPQDLERILAVLPAPDDPAVLVGTATADDAAVYRLADDLALVQTVDFFTPVVDDPGLFGRIAVANALSDLYAMGAVPRVGLNVVGFPTRRLPLSVLQAILRGAAEQAEQAGLLLLGGHTIDAPEPFYGLAATGTAAPEAVWRNDTARVGDAFVLTKPLGTGILATALKRGLATGAEADASADVMAALNAPAAEAVRAAGGPSACTDVTGFGLLGHLREMAAGSGVDVRLDVGAVPVLPGARRHAAVGAVPGGTRQNLAHVAPHVDFTPEVAEADRLLLADAQTSGGLLVAFPARRIEELLDALRTRGIEGSVIGEVAGAGGGRIWVTGTRSDQEAYHADGSTAA